MIVEGIGRYDPYTDKFINTESTMRPPVGGGFFNNRIGKVKDMKEGLPSFIIDQAKLRPPKFND